MLNLRKYFRKVEKSNPKNTRLFDILGYFREVETNEHSLQAFGLFINCHYSSALGARIIRTCDGE